MRRKTVGIIVTILVLILAGAIGCNLRDLPQKRLLHAAEDMVFMDADSTLRLLAQIDTTRLAEDGLMLYELLQAMVDEERWYLHHADTVSCLSSDAETWNFKREATCHDVDDQAFPDDSTLSRVYHYYEQASLGGTNDDKETLRRFGRICLC